MPLNKKQRAMLSGQVLVDSKFREAFMKDPKKAAKKLSIDLTENQHDEMLSLVDEIKKIGKKTDKIFSNGGLEPTKIAFIFLV